MLLKDLEIEVKDHGVFISANVIIKRNEKFYSVYNNYFSETFKQGEDYDKPTIQFINESIQDYLLRCKKIDIDWRVERAESAERRKDTGAMIMEHEIQL